MHWLGSTVHDTAVGHSQGLQSETDAQDRDLRLGSQPLDGDPCLLWTSRSRGQQHQVRAKLGQVLLQLGQAQVAPQGAHDTA